MSGTSPVTISNMIAVPAPVRHTLDTSNIHELSEAYAKHAREHGDIMRAHRAELLNKHKRALKALGVGD